MARCSSSRCCRLAILVVVLGVATLTSAQGVPSGGETERVEQGRPFDEDRTTAIRRVVDRTLHDADVRAAELLSSRDHGLRIDFGALQESESVTDASGGSAETMAAPGRYGRFVDESGWTADLILYLWLPFVVKGDSTVGPITGPLDLTIGDVFDTFTPFALYGRVELWKDNQFGFIFDGMYARLNSIDLSLPFGQGTANLGIEQAMLDFLVAWRPLNIPLGDDAFPRLIFDVAGGLRVQYLSQRLRSSSRPELGGSEWFVEPAIGGRVIVPFSPEWLINFRGEVSGFGIGNASDLTWSFVAGLGWSANDWFSMQFGYRFLGIDYSSGGGLDALGLDVTMHGPWLGFQFTF